MVGVLLVVGAALGVVAAMVRAHRVAQAGADLAALAGAHGLALGRDGCLEAGRIAAANDVRLTACRVEGRDAGGHGARRPGPTGSGRPPTSRPRPAPAPPDSAGERGPSPVGSRWAARAFCSRSCAVLAPEPPRAAGAELGDRVAPQHGQPGGQPEEEDRRGTEVGAQERRRAAAAQAARRPRRAGPRRSAGARGRSCRRGYSAGASARRTSSSRTAPCLSSGWFWLPHFGDCTHDGQPSGQRARPDRLAGGGQPRRRPRRSRAR